MINQNGAIIMQTDKNRAILEQLRKNNNSIQRYFTYHSYVPIISMGITAIYSAVYLVPNWSRLVNIPQGNAFYASLTLLFAMFVYVAIPYLMVLGILLLGGLTVDKYSLFNNTASAETIISFTIPKIKKRMKTEKELLEKNKKEHILTKDNYNNTINNYAQNSRNLKQYQLLVQKTLKYKAHWYSFL